jgi:hypothetical protein
MRYASIGLMALLLLSGCSTKESPDLATKEPQEQKIVEASVPLPYDLSEKYQLLNDLQEYSQNAYDYAGKIESRTALVKVQKQFEPKWFAPWNYTKPPQSLDEILWPFESYRSGDSYGMDLKPLNQAWFDTMHERGNFAAYGTDNRYAVSLQFSHLRNFPTHKPLFKDPNIAGEGFPFDYLQNSGVHANEPLYISHYSKEGDWVYVFSSYATGWLPSNAIALIPKAFTRQWQGAKQLSIVKERVAVKDMEGRFLFNGRIGMLMPLIGIQDDGYRVLAVTAGPAGKAWYTEAIIDKDAVTESILLLGNEELPKIANEMLKSRYGWGGLYEERDCSSTLRDLYTPFGIWLPRNSSQQAKIGQVIDLSQLNEAEKLERIKREGIPFETLLYRKGHIVLYIGTHEGRVMILHNMWGVKTTNGIENGRKLVGGSVISTLHIGSELKSYDEENDLLRQLESMNIITAEPLQPQ